jgi:hypothetical protein
MRAGRPRSDVIGTGSNTLLADIVALHLERVTSERGRLGRI